MNKRDELNDLYQQMIWYEKLELTLRLRWRLLRPEAPSRSNSPRIARLAVKLMLAISAISAAFTVISQDITMLFLPVYFFLYTVLVLVIRQVQLKTRTA